MEHQFKEKMNAVFGHLAQPGKQVTDDDIRSLMFGDYMASKEEDKMYNEIKDLDALRVVSLIVISAIEILSNYMSNLCYTHCI